VESREGYVDFRGHRTWYRVVGESAEGRDPLVALHGGPGSTHNYFTPLERLAEGGRAVVLYDQIGCGSSDRPQDIEWGVDVFLDELATLRDRLGLERVHLLGTSWGGQLALEHALSGYGGLTSLVLSSTLASIEEWVLEARRLRAALPADVVEVLDRHEQAGTFDDPEYREALGVFDDHYIHRGARGTPELARMYAEKGPEVYRAMVGPNEWMVTGKLKGWDVRDRLGEITVPALVARGAYDICTEKIARTLLGGLPNARYAVFEESSHMPALEESDRYLEVVGAFLREAESA
jgi:proline-specific peptidase